MSFNKRIVPDFEDLLKMREEIGNDFELVKTVVGKSDCLIGDTRSIDMIKKIQESLGK